MRQSFSPTSVAATFVLSALQMSQVHAQSAGPGPQTRRDSNIAAADTRSTIAPVLPTPAIASSDPPQAFLQAARRAVVAGRTGEAQEALERAETRLLDLGELSVASPQGGDPRGVLDITMARRSLAARNLPGAVSSIDAALAAIATPLQASISSHLPVSPSPVLYAAARAAGAPYADPPAPVITRALLPGHWQLRGARYVWVPPETTLRRVATGNLVPGAYEWREGAYVWVPAHFSN